MPSPIEAGSRAPAREPLSTSSDTPRSDRPRRRWLVSLGMVGIVCALGIVIVAPIALSSQDLVRWAADPDGLGLPLVWAWLAFVALDAAAAVCVGMISVAAWRGEGGGSFHVLTWLFALGSAVANYRHGQTTPARDDEYFFPAMSLAGPLLLDVTLARIRRWVRIEAQTQMVARPRFGLRWLPGVGFRETLRAWQTSLREGIERPADAIAHVREVRALAGLEPADALGFAWQALGHTDPYVAWRWLVARGVTIDQATVLRATRALAVSPATSVGVPQALPQVGHRRPLPLVASPGAGRDVAVPEPVRPPVPPAEPAPRTREGSMEKTPRATGRGRRPTALGAEELERRLSDAVDLLAGNPELTAAQLEEQLRSLGWTLSTRTASRVLVQARERARALPGTRLSAVR